MSRATSPKPCSRWRSRPGHGLKDHETAARHLRSIADELAPEDGSEVRSGGVARQRLRFLAAQANRG